jgi:hypothetical protein
MTQLSVNFDKVSNEKDLSPIVRMLSLKIMQTPYMTVADFFNWISDDDLDQLQKMVDTADTLTSLKNLILVSEMLSSAEGLYTDDESEALEKVNSLCAYISCASLGRKNLALVNYSAMTFGDDNSDAWIIKALDNNENN